MCRIFEKHENCEKVARVGFSGSAGDIGSNDPVSASKARRVRTALVLHHKACVFVYSYVRVDECEYTEMAAVDQWLEVYLVQCFVQWLLALI